jgi:hypothetical protein
MDPNLLLQEKLNLYIFVIGFFKDFLGTAFIPLPGAIMKDILFKRSSAFFWSNMNNIATWCLLFKLPIFTEKQPSASVKPESQLSYKLGSLSIVHTLGNVLV